MFALESSVPRFRKRCKIGEIAKLGLNMGPTRPNLEHMVLSSRTPEPTLCCGRCRREATRISTYNQSWGSFGFLWRKSVGARKRMGPHSRGTQLRNDGYLLYMFVSIILFVLSKWIVICSDLYFFCLFHFDLCFDEHDFLSHPFCICRIFHLGVQGWRSINFKQLSGK